MKYTTNKADRHKSRAPSNQQSTDWLMDQLTDGPTDQPTEWLIELHARD